MKLLAPMLLPALLLALLPIVIHLLNRLRYKTVKWAAIMFLIKANQSSTRNARLRQWLILAARSLAIFFFVFLFTRPIMGGWFGSVMAGKPEVVMLLLDRSASMETKNPRTQMTKREQVVDKWISTAKDMGGGTRFVLIDHVLRDPQTIAGPEAMRSLALAGPTDTAADIPALLRAALEYLRRNPGEKTEIWIASDLQESNWHPRSREWTTLEAQFGDLPTDVQFRRFDFTEESAINASVAITDVQRPRADELEITASFQRSLQAFPENLLARVGKLEIPNPLDLEDATEATLPFVLPVDEEKEEGWGLVRLPVDENARDNEAYFVFGGEHTDSAVVVAERGDVGELLQLAVFPDGKRRLCRQVPPSAVSEIDPGKEALLLWQGGGTTTNIEARLEEFVADGGQLLCLPPGDARPGLFGLEWGDPVGANPEAPLEIESYDEIDGPLANAADGTALPLRRMKVRRYQSVEGGDRWQIAATFTDTGTFLLQRNIGQGRIFALTTLPDYEWSDLGEPAGAVVLVPMVQRLLAEGGQRLARVRSATCGQWRPDPSDPSWEALDTEDYKDPRWNAGVYRAGPRLLALNRPAAEDDPATLDPEEAKALFGDLQVQVLGQKELDPNRRNFTEIWRVFVYLALLFLLVEGALLLMERKAAPVRA